jgi:hypothetical protein
MNDEFDVNDTNEEENSGIAKKKGLAAYAIDTSEYRIIEVLKNVFIEARIATAREIAIRQQEVEKRYARLQRTLRKTEDFQGSLDLELKKSAEVIALGKEPFVKRLFDVAGVEMDGQELVDFLQDTRYTVISDAVSLAIREKDNFELSPEGMEAEGKRLLSGNAGTTK